jgi:hypothetical protein
MAGYRKLAEQAVARQESLHAELSVLTGSSYLAGIV